MTFFKVLLVALAAFEMHALDCNLSDEHICLDAIQLYTTLRDVDASEDISVGDCITLGVTGTSQYVLPLKGGRFKVRQTWVNVEPANISTCRGLEVTNTSYSKSEASAFELEVETSASEPDALVSELETIASEPGCVCPRGQVKVHRGKPQEFIQKRVYRGEGKDKHSCEKLGSTYTKGTRYFGKVCLKTCSQFGSGVEPYTESYEGIQCRYRGCPNGFSSPTKDHCTKPVRGRGVGKIPKYSSYGKGIVGWKKKCKKGYTNRGLWCDKSYCTGSHPEKYAGLCYKPCPRGFVNAGGPLCNRRCPRGLTEFGVGCLKRKFTRNHLPLQCAKSEEWDAARKKCYKKCSEGTPDGAYCVVDEPVRNPSAATSFLTPIQASAVAIIRDALDL